MSRNKKATFVVSGIDRFTDEPLHTITKAECEAMSEYRTGVETDSIVWVAKQLGKILDHIKGRDSEGCEMADFRKAAYLAALTGAVSRGHESDACAFASEQADDAERWLRKEQETRK